MRILIIISRIQLKNVMNLYIGKERLRPLFRILQFTAPSRISDTS